MYELSIYEKVSIMTIKAGNAQQILSDLKSGDKSLILRMGASGSTFLQMMSHVKSWSLV